MSKSDGLLLSRSVVLQVKLFAPYASEFEAFVDASLGYDDAPENASGHFDGPAPYEALRALIPVKDLRAAGVFFTGPELAERLWSPTLSSLTETSIVVDPACGAGDLLFLPAAHLSRMHPRASITNQIRGADLEDSFLRTARARLRSVHRNEDFSHFILRDFLHSPDVVRDASHVVMNPPFFATTAPDTCDWAAGKVNSAALFAMQAAESMAPGSRLLAILPDVLRSGARYAKWRSRLSGLGQLIRVQALGQFDQQTDVHVFVLEMIIGAPNFDGVTAAKWMASASSPVKVSDLFEVRVGPVVPHRDPESGPSSLYLTTKNLASRSHPHQRRQYNGKLYNGPMVLVSRTSRPGQLPRARATLWLDAAPVAVENHLILLMPLDQEVATCLRLRDVLSDQRTSDYLDERIRCRHLTVGSVREIPWLEAAA
ncbi:N-6 DNA methylase [Cryobacterium soli]|uniref:N-6 DNA methylase n=1 Tax=Cryobacterium soli TaxID=2220095 RepID=UPI000E714B4B